MDPGEPLGPQPFEPPRAAIARVAEPVVEAMLASLPELHRPGLEAVAAPVRRERASSPSKRASNSAKAASSASRDATGRLCCDTHAPIRASRGRVRK